MSVKHTLWQLLDSYHVEVPIIQRDYAQGRSDPKATQIRKGFVSSLHDMVINVDATQDLDFIYGSVKQDKLVLLDGQQRLTTLFLLHWYVSTGSGKSGEARNKLKKFRYETRVSSREFFESLINYSESLILSEIEGKLSDSIKDAHWFFSIWCNDPTVQSMLNMLDEIHNVFKVSLTEDEELWGKLICSDNPPITFHFLNMQDFSLTDELYIKMNARGRPLTEFENFKAWLQSYCEKENAMLVPERFWHFMDKEWTDVFWQLRNTGIYEIDNLFLRCFKSIALANAVKGLEIPPKKLDSTDDELVSALRDNVYIPNQVYIDRSSFDGNTLIELSRFLDLMHQIQTSPKGSRGSELWDQCHNIFKDILKENGYLEQARFYALFRFVTERNIKTDWPEADLNELSDWLGVALRLINNTAFDISLNYARAVQSLADLSALLQDGVMTTLSTLDVKEIRYFREEQRSEEILKAFLVVNDPSWSPLLRRVEKEDYFYGQIGFLLEGSFDKSNESYCQGKFKEYGAKATALYSDDLIETNDFLLQRALLSIGNYLISDKSNLSFCRNTKTSARYRYENWRRVFNSPEKVKYLFTLLNKVEQGREREGLTEIIEDADTNDWRQYFIDYPEAISYCKKRHVRFEYDDSGEIYLLHGERMSGRHFGLKTYALYFEVKKSEDARLKELQGWLKPYYEAIGDNTLPGIYFELPNEIELQVEYQNDTFSITVFDRKENKESTDESILDTPGFIALKDLMGKLDSIEVKSEVENETEELCEVI